MFGTARASPLVVSAAVAGTTSPRFPASVRRNRFASTSSLASSRARTRRSVRVNAAKGGPNPRGGKKVSKKRVIATKQELIDQDNKKDTMIAVAMREAARAAARSALVEDESASNSDSFEDKLVAVKEAGRAKRLEREAFAPTFMDEMASIPAEFKKNKSIYTAAAEGSMSSSGGDDNSGVDSIIRVLAGLITIGLILVFIPSDLTVTAPVPQRELSSDILEQVAKQVEEYEKALRSSPEDVDKLRVAAESYIVLEDYAAAAPLLARLLEIEPSVDNVDNLADVYKAAGMKAKAAEVYKNAVNAAWSGEVPSSLLLKGLIDALNADGRYGLSLSYVKSFAEKNMADDVDVLLLEARVYSSWIGHGKDAEASYQKVIDAHGEDFRGYLAKGVFCREIGKPAEADALFRQAKSIAPEDMRDVVSAVISQAMSGN